MGEVMGVRAPRKRDYERALAAAQTLWTAAHDLDDAELIRLATSAIHRAKHLAGDSP
jgi:hypothetical protein